MPLSHPHLRTLAYVLVYVLVGFLVVGVLTLIVQTREVVGTVREQQQESAARGKDIQATARIIADCTDPTGECFKRGQQRTAGAVESITDATVRASAYAAACADQPGVQGPDEIFACVVRKFAAADGKRP